MVNVKYLLSKHGAGRSSCSENFVVSINVYQTSTINRDIPGQ